MTIKPNEKAGKKNLALTSFGNLWSMTRWLTKQVTVIGKWSQEARFARAKRVLSFTSFCIFLVDDAFWLLAHEFVLASLLNIGAEAAKRKQSFISLAFKIFTEISVSLDYQKQNGGIFVEKSQNYTVLAAKNPVWYPWRKKWKKTREKTGDNSMLSILGQALIVCAFLAPSQSQQILSLFFIRDLGFWLQTSDH